MATTFVKTLKLAKIQQDQAFVEPSSGKPTQLTTRIINDNNQNVEALVNALAQQVADQQAIIERLVAAEDNIDKANTAITNNARQQKLVNSYTDPAQILSAVTNSDGSASISIAAHKRVYADAAKTTVNVAGGTVSGLLANTGYVVYYNDTLQTGGTVTYIASTNGNDALQTGAVHSVGYLQTPATSADPPSDGGGSGGPGTGPRCIAATAMLHDYTLAEDVEVGHEVMILDYDNDHFVFGEIIALDSAYEACVTIVTESGIELTCSVTTPVQIWTGETIPVLQTLGYEVATLDNGMFCWEEVVELRPAGVRRVIQIDCGDKNYAAGDVQDRLIFTHNKPVNQERVAEQ